jgi:hypothetical protein
MLMADREVRAPLYRDGRRNAAERQRSQASAVTGWALPQWLQWRLFEARRPSQPGQ